MANNGRQSRGSYDYGGRQSHDYGPGAYGGRVSQDYGQPGPDTSYQEDGPDPRRASHRFINPDNLDEDMGEPISMSSTQYDDPGMPPPDLSRDPEPEPIQEVAQPEQKESDEEGGGKGLKGFFGRKKKKDKKDKKDKEKKDVKDKDRESTGSLKDRALKMKGMLKKKSKKGDDKEADESDKERSQPLQQYESEPESAMASMTRADLDSSISKPPVNEDDGLPPAYPQPFDPSPGGYAINPSDTLHREQSSFSKRAAASLKKMKRQPKLAHEEGRAELKPMPKSSIWRSSVVTVVLLILGFVAGIIMTASAGDDETLQVIGPIFIGLSLFALVGKIYFTLFLEPETHPMLQPISEVVNKSMGPTRASAPHITVRMAADLDYPRDVYPPGQDPYSPGQDPYFVDQGRTDDIPLTTIGHTLPIYDEPPPPGSEHNTTPEEDIMPPPPGGDYRDQPQEEDNQGVVFGDNIDEKPRCVQK